MPELVARDKHEGALGAALGGVMEDYRLLAQSGQNISWTQFHADIKRAAEQKLAESFRQALSQMASDWDAAIAGTILLLLSSQWASRYSETLATEITSTTKQRVNIAQAQSNALIAAGEATQAVTTFREAIESTFGKARIENIAITETTRSTSAAEKAAREIIIRDKKIELLAIWVTEHDSKVCPICKPLHNKREADWADKFPLGSPAHPGCRCHIRYVEKLSGGPGFQDRSVFDYSSAATIRARQKAGDCGTGSGGFKLDNTCATGGTSGESETSLVDAIKEHGGFTYQPTSDTSPKTGYAVSSFSEHELVISPAELTEDKLTDYILEKWDVLKDPSVHVGGWHDKDADKVYLDMIRVVDTEAEAASLAKEHNQEGYHDLEKGKTIIVKSAEERRLSYASIREANARRWREEGRRREKLGAENYRESQRRKAAPVTTWKRQQRRFFWAKAEDCGTGSGGFKPDNTCAQGDGQSAGKYEFDGFTAEEQESLSEWQGKAPPYVIEAVHTYTGGSYRDINTSLRECPVTLDCFGAFPEDLEVFNNVHKAIDSAGEFDEPMTLYRGINMDFEDSNQLVNRIRTSIKNNDTIRFDGIVSLSADPGIATSFGGEATAVFSIKAKTGASIADISRQSYEEEFLHKHGTRYRPIRIQDGVTVGSIENVTVIHMEEI